MLVGVSFLIPEDMPKDMPEGVPENTPRIMTVLL